MRCPICEREFDPASPAAAKPFCSSRCRTIDLGRWLGESYSLADPEFEPDAERETSADVGDSDDS